MKRAPVQGFSAGIPWDMHLRAYDAYCKRYSPQEALIQGQCRGGFGVDELDMFIPGWREELDERKTLAARIEALEQALREIAQQKLSDELDEHEREWADYHDGWDQAVKCARAALAQTGEANG